MTKNDWESIEKSEPFFTFKTKNTIKIQFLSNDFKTNETQFNGKKAVEYIFEGIDLDDAETKILSVTSKRLMLKLKEIRPLQGKNLSITRVGAGFSTDYIVQLLKN